MQERLLQSTLIDREILIYNVAYLPWHTRMVNSKIREAISTDLQRRGLKRRTSSDV